MGTEHREFIIDGKRLETLTIGNLTPAVPTLVFLHAGLGSLALWKDFPLKVVERIGLSAMIYSRYGYGQSDPLVGERSSDYLHKEAQRALPELLDKFNITRPIFVGHSDGATISLLFAARFPERPVALILEAPHIFVEDITIAGLKEIKQAYEKGKLLRALRPHHIDAEAAFKGWNNIWLNPQFRSWNIEAELKTITCPILLIQGEEDQYGTIEQLEGIKRQTPSTELFMIPDCRHSPHEDHPELVLERVEMFIHDLKVTAP